MKLTRMFTDDHLPCVEFIHNEKVYELLWTDEAIIGRLEMVQDGDVSLDVALKKFPQLRSILNGTLAGEEIDSEVDEEEKSVSWYLDAGCLVRYDDLNKGRRLANEDTF